MKNWEFSVSVSVRHFRSKAQTTHTCTESENCLVVCCRASNVHINNINVWMIVGGTVHLWLDICALSFDFLVFFLRSNTLLFTSCRFCGFMCVWKSICFFGVFWLLFISNVEQKSWTGLYRILQISIWRKSSIKLFLFAQHINK